MPSADQHRNKAERNRRFLATIAADEHPDWAVVAAFYVAVHLVERLRAWGGHGDSIGHQDRLTYVQLEHPAIHAHYRILQDASMLARYASNADFFVHIQPADIPDRIIAQRLVPIETYVAVGTGG